MRQESANEFIQTRGNIEKSCADSDNRMPVENVAAIGFRHQPAPVVTVARVGRDPLGHVRMAMVGFNWKAR